MIIISIFITYVFAQDCDTTQYFGNISQPSAFLPIYSIQQQLTQQYSLIDSANYTNIQITPKLVTYEISDYVYPNYQLILSINCAIYFQTFDNILGQAAINGITITLNLTFVQDTYTWIQNGTLTYLGPSTVNWMGFQYFQSTFTSLQTLFNQQITSQFITYYQALILTFSSMPNSFTYVYTNIQGEQQSVLLNTTTNSFLYNSGVIQQTYFYVENFDNNNCTALPTVTTTTQPEFEVISDGVLQSVFNYANSMGYFNTILNQKWRSAEFQFLVGSAQNVLTGLEGVYPENQAINGSCTANTGTLSINNDNTLNATFNYTCVLNQLNSELNIPLFSINFNLQLKLTIEQRNNSMLYFTSNNPQIGYILFTSGSSQLKESYQSLASLYIKSIVELNFNNTNVFGSEFPTIPRSNPVITIDQTQISMYDSTVQ